ncbi:unnamed protein product [Cunninghamella blakesleeana]
MVESIDDSLLDKYLGFKDKNLTSILFSPIVFGLSILIYAISLTTNRLLFSFFIAIAFVLGALYFSRSNPPQDLFTQQKYELQFVWKNPVLNDKLDEDQYATLQLFYPPLTTIVEKVLSLFYTDYVKSWWDPLKSGYDDEFEKVVKLRLNAAVTNVEKMLLRQERNDIVMATMYGLANTLIIHMRECRTFEMTEQPIDVFINENPQSPFAQLLSRKEQHQQLRGLSKSMLKRILPADDMNSMVVQSLLRELLTTHLFGNILTTLSDPDFINSWIVTYLTETPGDKSTTENNYDSLPTSSLSPSSTSNDIRSLVEKATEDVMAAEKESLTDATSNSDHVKLPPTSIHPMTVSEMGQSSSTINNSSNNPLKHSPPTTPESITNENNIFMDEKSSPLPSLSSSVIPPSTPQRSLSISSITSTSSSSHIDPKRRMTLSKTDEELIQTPMIYAYGTVSFSVMDISPPKESSAAMDKSKLMYIIQIERPAIQEGTGSEGGGYVITRTYLDFDVFHSLMKLKHSKRVARLSLKLPLEVTKTWLQKSKSVMGIGNNNNNNNNNNNMNNNDNDIMGFASSIYGNNSNTNNNNSNNSNNNNNNNNNSIPQGLEHYLDTVVADAELGRDPLILAFLRKERATERGTTQDELSFADEYKDELVSYNNQSNLLVDTTSNWTPTMGNRAKSLFSRTSLPSTSIFGNTTSSPSSSIGSTFFSNEDIDAASSDDIHHHNKKTCQGSISSIQSHGNNNINNNNNNNNSESIIENHSILSSIQKRNSDDTISASISSLEKETAIVNKPKHKPLSAMDTELLIETTFALIVESFNLTTANNKAWMRRSLLNLLREIVRRSYTELVAKQYNDYMEAYLSPDALVQWMTMIKDNLFDANEDADADHPNEDEDDKKNTKTKIRTDEEKEQTKQQAKLLLVQRAVPSGVRQLIGDQNCSLSMERIWYRLQNEEFNRVLVLQVMERVIRPIFN